MKKITYILSLLLFVLCSCRGVQIPEAANIGLGKAQNLRYTATGRTVTLQWEIEHAEDVTAVQITCNGEAPVLVDGAVTRYEVRHVVPNKDVYYTVKLLYRNGLVSEGITICVNIRYDQPIYYGYVLAADSPESLPDDDEIAAAQWFRSHYVDCGIGRFIQVADVQYIDLDEISTLWVHIDRTGIQRGWDKITGGYATEAFVGGLRRFVEEGGNVLLTTHATQFVEAIGRIEPAYAVNEFNSGDGGTGNDIWTLNAFIGMTYDHRGDVYFQGMELGDYNGYEYTTFPMLGPGLREDHNSMWNLSSMSFVGAVDKTRGFEQANECTVLGTWGQNTEFTFPGMVDFAPTGTYMGRIVALGLGCYEWHQGDNNIYQSQIERLTENTLTYLHDN